jgi:hypothetical protein
MSDKILRVGQRVCINTVTSATIGKHRNLVNASDSKGAGQNLEYHIKGVAGEMATRQALGRLDLPLCLDRVDRNPDILNTQPMIEAKCGLPLVDINKVRRDLLYVVWEYDDAKSELEIIRLAEGWKIIKDHIYPPHSMCPRTPFFGNSNVRISTRYSNLLIMPHLSSTIVHVK